MTNDNVYYTAIAITVIGPAPQINFQTQSWEHKDIFDDQSGIQ